MFDCGSHILQHHQQAPGMPSPAPTEALSDGKPAFPYQQQALLGGQVFGDANMVSRISKAQECFADCA